MVLKVLSLFFFANHQRSVPFSSLRSFPRKILSHFSMSTNLRVHAFAGNPMASMTPKPSSPFSPSSALETLRSCLLESTHLPNSPNFKVLPFRKGRPLGSTSAGGDSVPNWYLGWVGLADLKEFGVELSVDSLVYLGSRLEEDVVYWGIDVSSESGLVAELGSRRLCFVELRTLMVATDSADAEAMGELAVAGHVNWSFLVSISMFESYM